MLDVVACADPTLVFPVVGVAEGPGPAGVEVVGVDPDPAEDCAGGISVDALQICAYDRRDARRRVVGVVRFVGLELPTFDVVGRARDRVLRWAVVGIDPRPRGPVPIRPVVVVAGADALAAVLHAIGRIVVDGAEKARVAVGHVGRTDGGSECVGSWSLDATGTQVETVDFDDPLPKSMTTAT